MNNELILLQEQLNGRGQETLWCADEQTMELSLDGFQGQILCNRFHPTLPALFSDFNFADAEPGKLQRVIFRIAKEKAINHHIIHQAFKYLPENGELVLIGYKNEGINSLKSNINKSYACEISSSKHGKQLQQLIIRSLSPQDQSLNERPYEQLELIEQDYIAFFSKPGLFGWNKIDAGSELLISTIIDFSFNDDVHCLDLGCGYGYLSIRTATDLGINRIDATDNCAAAITACRRNFDKLGIEGEVIAGNCADTVKQKYDLILCNPPFHQGFDHEKNLTQLFVEAAARHLKPGGMAFFVVNQFIGIEKAAMNHFQKMQQLTKKEGFKVIQFIK